MKPGIPPTFALDRRTRRKESVASGVFKAAAVATVLASAAIVVSLAGKAMDFLAAIDIAQLWGEGWFPRRAMFDLRTVLGGTLLITAIAMLVATPIGLGAAVYLAEFASRRKRRWIKPVIEILAGIPSVVIGFFALTAISPRLVAPLCGRSSIFNMAAAGIGVGILVTPLVASIAEDALRAVPSTLKEAALGLGSHRATAIIRVVMPAAVSGIVAALIIGASRAIGETMVVAVAAGATGGSMFSLDPCLPGQTMTAAMTALAVGSDRVGQGGAVESLFFLGALLFAITMALNLLGDRLVRRFRKAY